MLKRLAAVLLVGAFYLTSALAWPAPGYAQVVSSRQAVCDPQYPTRCIKPAADGSIAVTGGGGGGSGATASASALPVVAGTGKPQNIDLFSSTGVIVRDASGNNIDWTAATPVTQSGTWTVQPGNTANTTAWKVDGSAVTQPVSAAALPLPTGASTAAKQPALGTSGTPSADVITVQGAASMTAIQVGGAAVDGAAAGTTSPAPVGGIYVSTLPTYTAGARTQWVSDSSGNLRVNVTGISNTAADAASNSNHIRFFNNNSTTTAGLLDASGYIFNGSTWDRQRGIAGSFGKATGVLAVEQAGASFTRISTATTTTVKSGAGILHKILVNTAVASATITIYDDTTATGTVVGIVTLPSTVGNPFTLTYDLSVGTGITIVTSDATDLTVVYR